MKSSIFIIFTVNMLAVSLACSDDSKSGNGSSVNILDVSKTDAQQDCKSTHSFVGQSFSLSTLSHLVSGNVNIIDDCTMEFTNFNYDGAGRQVEIYGFMNDENKDGTSLSVDLLRPGNPYINNTLIVRLPKGSSLDDLKKISVWCTAVGASFGEAILEKKI